MNLSSLTPEANQPSPIPFPPDPVLVQPGQIASLDLHTTYSATGIGVDSSLTRAFVVAVPGLNVARHHHGMWPADLRGSSLPLTSVSLEAPAAQCSLNQQLLTASTANRVCIAGLGCNKAKSLTDPGFSRVSIQTDKEFVGSYFICVDGHTTCFVVSALPLLSTSACPTSTITQPAVFRVVQLPDLTPCGSVGTISLLEDPIGPILGGEHVASIAVGASFGAFALRLTGAAGDLVSGFRVRAHMLEAAADSSVSGPPLVDPASWRTSSGVLLRGEWSLLSNASGVAVMPDAFGSDWLLPSSSAPSSIFHLVFCIDAEEASVICSGGTSKFRLVWGDPLVRRQAQQGMQLTNIKFTLQPPAFVVPGESFHSDSEAGNAEDVGLGKVASAGTIEILPTFTSHSAGLQFWRPPSLQLVALRELPAATERGANIGDAAARANEVEDGLVTACRVHGIYRWQWLQDQTPTSRLVFSDSTANSSNASSPSSVTNTSSTTLETRSGSAAFPSFQVRPAVAAIPSYTQEWQTRAAGVAPRVRWEVSSLRMGACIHGVYRLAVRAVPDADISPQRLLVPSLPAHRLICPEQPWALLPRTLQPPRTAAPADDTLGRGCPAPWAPHAAQLSDYANGAPPAGTATESVVSRAFNVAAHGQFRLSVSTQPPETVETLLVFSTSVLVIGNTEALLEGVLVTCSLEEDSVAWPGVSEAAFDSGGYPPIFAPLRNVSNVSDSSGVATFYLTLARADPSRRIRLRFTVFSHGDEAADRQVPEAGQRSPAGSTWMSALVKRERIALATQHSRYFGVRHHFARLSLERRLTYDEEVADFLTTPLGALEFADGGSPATMKGNLGTPGRPDPDDSVLNSSNFKLEVRRSNPMRILALTVSFDASIDAASIVPPVVAVFDHTEQFVGGLQQACKAAGCFNHVTLDKFKKDVIQLRIRYYLLNTNGSLIDAVPCLHLQRAPTHACTHAPYTHTLTNLLALALSLRHTHKLPLTHTYIPQRTHTHPLSHSQVSVMRVEDPVWGGVAEKKGYWWLASKFQPWLPSGFYRPV